MCPAGTTKIGAATLAGGIQEGVGTKDASRASTRWDEPMGVAGPAVTSKPYPLYNEEFLSVRPGLAGWETRSILVEYEQPPEYLSVSPGLADIAVTGPYEYVEMLAVSPGLEVVQIAGPYGFEEYLNITPGFAGHHFSLVQDQTVGVMAVTPGLEGVLIS